MDLFIQNYINNDLLLTNMMAPSFSSPDRNFFPSFAPSPEPSPPKTYPNHNDTNIHKITIDLPEAFVESTTDDQ